MNDAHETDENKIIATVKEHLHSVHDSREEAIDAWTKLCDDLSDTVKSHFGNDDFYNVMTFFNSHIRYK